MHNSRAPKVSLSIMMLLQYAVWGVWLPYLATYLQASIAEGGLGFTSTQVGWILGLAGSIGAVTAPFLGGQIADRFMNAERWLAILLIIGGVLKFITASVHDYNVFLILSIFYSVFYMPTLALTNSIAFAHLGHAERDFPIVRTWGTIGWIIASNAFPLIWLQHNVHVSALPPFFVGEPLANSKALIADALRVSGIMAVLYGVWAVFFLPKTPATRSVEHPLAFLRAFRLLTHRGFLVVTLVALPIAMIHQVFFIRTSVFLNSFLKFEDQYVGPIMSISQFSEIGFLAILGLFLKRLGYRGVLTIGCLAFAARYALFAISTEQTRTIAVAACVLHGICYGFFFAGSFLYVEKVAPADSRHSAQTVFGIIILGLGPVLAGLYNQWLDHAFPTDGVNPAWRGLWLVQAAIGLGSGILLALAFRPGSTRAEPTPATA
ncbi:MAG: MFS transporter [Tepidisphaera sp.]|nr:MFS transporter [Tepidisphaera sp.]